MFLSTVPIVLSSSHTTPPVAPKSTRLIQDRYIFLVEDTRGTKVSSVPVGTPPSATKGRDEGTETEGGNEEEKKERRKLVRVHALISLNLFNFSQDCQKYLK